MRYQNASRWRKMLGYFIFSVAALVPVGAVLLAVRVDEPFNFISLISGLLIFIFLSKIAARKVADRK